MKGTSLKRVKCGAWGLADVDQLLADVYKLFCKSTKRKKLSKAFVECNKLKLNHAFPMSNATRWFSRRDCLVQ
jgi:hypothetical protein